VEKLLEVTPIGPKVITADTLNFKPILKCLVLKIVRGPPFSMVCALASFGHFESAAPPRGRNMVF